MHTCMQGDIGSVVNIEEFSQAFNCPEDSLMHQYFGNYMLSSMEALYTNLRLLRGQDLVAQCTHSR